MRGKVEWESGSRSFSPDCFESYSPLLPNFDSGYPVVYSASLLTASYAEAHRELLARLEEFASLSEDWDGYGAAPISKSAIAFARRLLYAQQLVASRLSAPDVSPTPNGTIAMEWQEGDSEAVVEVGTTKVTGFARVAVPMVLWNGDDQEEVDERVMAALIGSLLVHGSEGVTSINKIDYQFEGND